MKRNLTATATAIPVILLGALLVTVRAADEVLIVSNRDGNAEIYLVELGERTAKDSAGKEKAEKEQEIASMADSQGQVTLLFSDIEDSTPLNERLGDDTWVNDVDAYVL